MKEDQLREDQRREALARREELQAEEPRREEARAEEPRREESHVEEPRREELRAAPFPADTPPPPPAPRVEEPKIDSKALLESSGLVMIETDRSKAPPSAPAEEPQHLGRPRRERPKPQAQDEPPLEQVETKR